jgi:methionyl-tRNA formyltransferase
MRNPRKENHRYLVAGNKSWHREFFGRLLRGTLGDWRFVTTPKELIDEVRRFRPRFAFFLHWSDRVPKAVLTATECVGFHMTDLPYGRGGSPLQNLIARGHQSTKLTAFQMTDGLDDGPVYAKQDLILEGTAESIYLQAAAISLSLIPKIINGTLRPRPQRGDPVVFRRRKPADSELRSVSDLRALHDFIRMLDADGYPRAFLNHGNLRFELSRSALYDGKVTAEVTITKRRRLRQ